MGDIDFNPPTGSEADEVFTRRALLAVMGRESFSNERTSVGTDSDDRYLTDVFLLNDLHYLLSGELAKFPWIELV